MSSPPTPTSPQSGPAAAPAGRSRQASPNDRRAGSTSTRNGRRARGTSAVRRAAWPAISRSAAACPCPEASRASSEDAALRAVVGEVSARAALDEGLPRMAPETESLIDEILPSWRSSVA